MTAPLQYHLTLTIFATLEKEGLQTLAKIKDRNSVVVGRGATRGDALNSAIKRWLGSIDPDLILRNGAERFQSYETQNILKETDDMKTLRISLGEQFLDVPAFWCEHFNFTKLGEKPAKDTAAMLMEAIERLGTKVDIGNGNNGQEIGKVGATCVTLFDWSKEKPETQWEVKQ